MIALPTNEHEESKMEVQIWKLLKKKDHVTMEVAPKGRMDGWMGTLAIHQFMVLGKKYDEKSAALC